MEEVNETGESIAIKELPPKGGSGGDGEKTYELIPEGTYQAEYLGLKTKEYVDKKYGPKKKAFLKFKITKGAQLDRTTSYTGNLYRNKTTGEFFVGPESDLAKVLKVITRGSMVLEDKHKGAKVLIEITHQQNKDKTKTWDFATNVMRAADDDDAAPAKPAAPAAQAAKAPAETPAPAKAAAPAAAAPAAAKPESDLLSDLTELGDFKL